MQAAQIQTLEEEVKNQGRLLRNFGFFPVQDNNAGNAERLLGSIENPSSEVGRADPDDGDGAVRCSEEGDEVGEGGEEEYVWGAEGEVDGDDGEDGAEESDSLEGDGFACSRS